MVDIQFVKASDYCESVVDGTHDSPKPCDEGFYLITSKHLLDYEINFASAYKISQADYNLITKRSSVKQWDILLSMIGTVGRVYIERNSNSEYACKNVGIFKCGGDRYKSLWLYYVLKSPYCKQYISKVLAGSTQSYISLGNLRAFPVPVIADEKRNRIIEALSTLDDKIDINNKIIKNLEEQLCLLYKSFILHKEHFIGIKPVSELFAISIGKTPPRKETEWFSKKEADIKWVSISDMGKSYPYIQNTSEYITKEAAEKFKIKVVPDNTILLSFKLTLGRICITDGEMATNEAIAHFPIEDESILEYLYCYLKTFNYETLGNTSSIATAVNSKIIKNMQIPVPKNDELDRFHHLTAPLLQQIKILSRQQSVLQNIREALLTKLISGEIELKNQ